MCATCNILRQLLIDRGMSPGLAMAIGNEAGEQIEMAAPVVAKKVKRKVSAYSKAYGSAYRSLRRKHTLKSGKLRKGYTHKRLVKMAHAEAKRRRKK